MNIEEVRVDRVLVAVTYAPASAALLSAAASAPLPEESVQPAKQFVAAAPPRTAAHSPIRCEQRDDAGVRHARPNNIERGRRGESVAFATEEQSEKEQQQFNQINLQSLPATPAMLSDHLTNGTAAPAALVTATSTAMSTVCGVVRVVIGEVGAQRPRSHSAPALVGDVAARPTQLPVGVPPTTDELQRHDRCVSDEQRFGCAHYKRRAMFVTPCCNKFYKCRFCHDENESHHFDRKTLTELICSECDTRQTVQEQCEQCGVRFGKYTCLICNLFDDEDKQQYHCDGCGICRIGGSDNFFHCEVCNMCLPIRLKIDGHRCVENVSRSHCPVCLGDIHTSRIPCHIPDCGHLLHKMCFDQLLASGHYACPTCQTSLIDMSTLWDYLDEQALRMPIPLKYENERIQIFCNDCHKASKTKFHFIGLKCLQCGAYNTTQDVKRRQSLVADKPTSA